MRSFRLVLAVLVCSAVSLGTTLLPHTLEQRAEQSDRIALVQVLSQRVEPSDGPVSLKTYTRVVVGANLKGSGPAELTIVQLGGQLGPNRIEVPDDASFVAGETAVVFLRCRLAEDRCHLVALGEGKLEVSGDRVLVKDMFTGKASWRSVTQLAAQLGATR